MVPSDHIFACNIAKTVLPRAAYGWELSNNVTLVTANHGGHMIINPASCYLKPLKGLGGTLKGLNCLGKLFLLAPRELVREHLCLNI